MIRRLKIYALLGQHPLIRWDNGDRINELRFLNVLSTFADVYYNGIPYSPGAESAGAQGPINLPEDGRYDLIYVRGNPELFSGASGRRIYLGLPYDGVCFKEADAILTTTEYWKQLIQRFPEIPSEDVGMGNYYDPSTFERPQNIINIEQSIDPRFNEQCRDHALTDNFRVRFGWGFTIAYMGRLHENSLPYDLIDAAPELQRRYADLDVVLAGPSKVDLSDRRISYAGRIPYQQMPYAISACGMMVYDHDSTGEWLGAGKVLDSIACDVPVLCRKHQARIEQLGPDYPLYFSSKVELIDRVCAYRDSAKVRRACHEILAERRTHYARQAVANRIEPQLRSLL